MKFEGRILSRSNIMSGTSQAGNPWQKQIIICETISSYPKKVAITAMNNSVELAKNVPDGAVVEAIISVESREYNGKWYTDVFLLNIGMKGNPATFMQQPPCQSQQPPQYQPQPMAAHQQPQYQQQSPMANPQPMQQPQYTTQQVLDMKLPNVNTNQTVQFHQQQMSTDLNDLPF